MIYLDHQSSTPMHPSAIAAMQAAMIDFVANPHSADHRMGWEAADAIESGRAAIAGAINADSDEIIFTSGATEANNLALLGATSAKRRRRKIVVSAIEHKAVLAPARELQHGDCELVFAPVTRSGVVDVDRLLSLIDDHTLLVSCMAVNNEIGTVQPVEAISSMCRDAGALLHVDASQALAWSAIDVVAAGADLVSLSGHKAGGPKGIGALFVRREIRNELRPILFGGEQEGGLRAGTLPTPLCVAFGAACRNLPDQAEIAAWRFRTAAFEQQIVASLPGTMVNGCGAPRHPGAISLTFAEADAEGVVMLLQTSVAISRGSACTSGILEPSHVLTAIGRSSRECDRSIRIGVGRYTTQDELESAAEAILRAVAEINSSHRRDTVLNPDTVA